MNSKINRIERLIKYDKHLPASGNEELSSILLQLKEDKLELNKKGIKPAKRIDLMLQELDLPEMYSIYQHSCQSTHASIDFLEKRIEFEGYDIKRIRRYYPTDDINIYIAQCCMIVGNLFEILAPKYGFEEVLQSKKFTALSDKIKRWATKYCK